MENTGKTTQQLRNRDEALWKEIKVRTIIEDVTLTEWVEDACKAKLAKIKKSK